MGTTDRARFGAGLRRRYENEGMTIRELAEELGRSEQGVRRALVAAGTEIGSPRHTSAWLARLEREGRVDPPAGPKTPLGPPPPALKDGTPLSEIVVAYREAP